MNIDGYAVRRGFEYLFSQRYKIACLKREFAQFYNASRLRKSFSVWSKQSML